MNEGKAFANLRQISNSVILATWYKQNIQGSMLEQIYINKNKTECIDTSDKEITISIAGTIQNFIGFDGVRGQALKNVNTFREDDGVKGIHYTTSGVDPESEQWAECEV